jgi:hypothetical protein
MSERGEIFQVVTQRVSKCRLLVSEESDEWIDMNGPGLVLYVSFVNGAPEQTELTKIDAGRIAKAIKSLMNAKLASSSGWKSDHSDAQSVTGLIGHAQEHDVVNVVIIPQATLAGRLIPGDKYLKYHRQVDKARGFELFSEFVRSVARNFDASAETDTVRGGQLDTEGLKISWGSYGKRQGWEMISTGPSTHYFEF